ncbi:MAG: VCBS repeat-containing protein [Cyclobacteriaceae bacterium]
MDSKTKKDIHSLYSILSPKQTGISFVNPIKESMYMNGLTYEYLYNGSGVAVGDVNNDGLVDIFFVSSLKNNELYLNEGGLKFKNSTAVSGLQGRYGFSTGVTMVDINSDGKLDIYICKSGQFNDPDKRKNELYINYGVNAQGIPVFKEEASKFKLDLPHQSTQATFFDYDRDGDLDLFLLNHGTDQSYYSNFETIPELLNTAAKYQSSQLFRNDKGKFHNVSMESGIIDNAISFGLGVGVGDLNNDGWPDILVGHDYAEKDQLYLNQKDGTFIEVIQQSTNHISNFSMGNDIADFNNDGLLDFISVDMVSESNYDIKTSMSGMNPNSFYQLTEFGLHHQYMFNTLQLNNGNFHDQKVPVFSDIAQLAGLSNTDWSWAPLFLDMDNDGFKDLFVSNGIKRDFRNNDFVNYKAKRTAKYLKDQKEIDDKVNLQEEYIKDLMRRIPKRLKNNLFFRNDGNLVFSKKNPDWQINALTSTTGAAYADLDNDGDLDIVTNNVDDYGFIYRNNTTEMGVGNNFVQFQLIGSNENPDGIGARILVKHGVNQQVVEQYLTRGFQSSISRKIHFGLGKSSSVDTLIIWWPDGKQQELTNIRANKSYILKYENAISRKEETYVKPLFAIDERDIPFTHQENDFDDFKRESLMPHRMSRFGPAMAVADLNSDGLEDLYLGGAIGQAGGIFLQDRRGKFTPGQKLIKLKDSEEVDGLFFDADNDKDLDLVVVTGGNEYQLSDTRLEDQLYINNGAGNFVLGLNILPKDGFSAGDVKTLDFDNDGDEDLLVTGRQVPGKYGFPASTRLYENKLETGRLHFEDVSSEKAKSFENIGMVTSSVCKDLNNDGRTDIMLAGEWTAPMVFINDGTVFLKEEQPVLDSLTGWWFSLSAADFDGDGDLDVIAGNLGENYKYKASKEEPFELHTSDFDANGSLDIVLSYNEEGKQYPLRGRECTSNQMPFVKEKFKTYHAFGQADLEQVYGAENLSKATHLQARTFSSHYFENDGQGNFKAVRLPVESQFSSINSIVSDDFDSDGNLDIVIVGNLYGSEVETPRADASYGLFLKGNGTGIFESVPAHKSGLYVRGDVRQASLLSDINGKRIVFARNDNSAVMFNVGDKPAGVLVASSQTMEGQ